LTPAVLTHLQIRDFAIVEAVELEFEPGFTVLTGETGAGKSILIDALLLAVGGRADSGAVRHGADRAEVSASFAIDGNPAAMAWLAEQSIAHEGECILRRVIGSDGRGRAYVNGQTMPLPSMRALGELLVDIHGQLEFQSLSRRSYQRATLDGSGGHTPLLETVRSAYRQWRALREERGEFEQRARDRDQRLELLRHYVSELDSLAAAPGEAEALTEERKRMASLGRLAEGTGQLEQLLTGDGGGILAALARGQTVARQLVAVDAALHETERLLEEAAIACREAAAGVRRYSDGLEADPQRQEWVEARLAALETAARKHRVEPRELSTLRESLSAELAELESAALSLGELDRRLAAADARYRESAAQLTSARQAAGTILDQKVTDLMQGLGMRGGLFQTRIEARDPVDHNESGNDEIEFLVSANPGQPPRPLAKVASGGELSRISLSLQVAAVDAAHLPCLVFDEVDAGVGGAVAEMVGRQLRALSAAGQVLCVTHLPQVAAQSQHQMRVAKSVVAGTTRTRIEPLDEAARIEEIARMLGGTHITDTTREHARELLAAAQKPARRGSVRSLKPATDGAGNRRARTDRGG